jgi:four helix bundle protein
MQYRRFEDLPVWQEAAELARLMYESTELEPFRRHPGLRDQLERAALSISNNIAEGFERGTQVSLSPSFTFLAVPQVKSGRC